MAKLLGLDKIANFLRIVKQNGGFINSFRVQLRTDDLKDGVCVGEDSFGNKYFENNRYFYGRNRWVIYNPKFGLEYDASQVNPDWYGWLHYKTDLLPFQDPSRQKYKWSQPYTENMSGTTGQYVPYSTTVPKIEVWEPKRRASTS